MIILLVLRVTFCPLSSTVPLATCQLKVIYVFRNKMTTGWPVNLQHLLGRVDLWSGAGAQYHHGGGAGGGVHHHMEQR